MDGKIFFYNTEYDIKGIVRHTLPKIVGDTDAKSAAWDCVPGLHTFRTRGTDAYTAVNRSCLKVAYNGDTLYYRMECVTNSNDIPEMRDHYDSWAYDNTSELFVAVGGAAWQFCTNARGAIYTYVDRCGRPTPEGVKAVGYREKGKWYFTLTIPLKALGVAKPEFIGVQATVMDNDSICGCQFFDLFNNTHPAEGFELFYFGDAMTASEAEKEEARLEADYRRYLRTEESVKLAELASMAVAYAKLCRQDLKRTKEFLAKEKEFLSGKVSAQEIRCAVHDLQKLTVLPRAKETTVDFGASDGEIRPLGATNFGPNMSVQSYRNDNDIYQGLHFSYARTHDAVLVNAGCRICDIPFVFPLEHADPSKPENYYFTQTDYYFENTRKLGTDIYYRLGVSIDHGLKKFTALCPENYEQYAEICAGIVRHYNHGWANGFHWNIKYWEFWNEPELISMFNKPMDEYIKLYCVVGKRLKSEFPEIKFGGGAFTGLYFPIVRKLAASAKAAGAPFDFFSWHRYSCNLNDMRSMTFAARALMDSMGYKDSEIHVTEWHRAGGGQTSKEVHYDMWGIDSGVFTAGTLALWQDSPLDLGCFYGGGFHSVSMYSLANEWGEPNKNYYALYAYGQMQHRFKHRVKALTTDDETVILAGKDDDGNGAILCCVVKPKGDTLRIAVKGLPKKAKFTVKELSAKKDLKPVRAKYDGSALTMKMPASPAVFFVTVWCSRR